MSLVYPYTDMELDLIRHYARLNYSTAEIAVEVTKHGPHRRNRLAIYRVCKKHNIKTKPFFREKTLIANIVAMRQSGIAPKVIASELGLTYDAVFGILTHYRQDKPYPSYPNKRYVWPEQRKQTLLSLINEGLTYRQIADRMDMTYQSVYQYCYKHDILLKTKDPLDIPPKPVRLGQSRCVMYNTSV